MANSNPIDKRQLIKKITKKAGISEDQAMKALQCFIDVRSVFVKGGGFKEVKTVKEKAVKVTKEGKAKKIELVKEKAVATKETIEKIKTVEVIKEVLVEVIKEVPVEIIKEIEVIKQAAPAKPAERIEIIKEVFVEVIKEVPVIEKVEVIKEVPVEVTKEIERIVEVEVIREKLSKR